MFAIPPRESHLFYRAEEPVWIGSKSFRALGTPTPVVFSYLTDRAQSDTGLEHDLNQMVDEVEYNVSSLGAFLRGTRYCLIE